MIKKIVMLTGLLACTVMSVIAQVEHPVKWAYGKKKIGPDTYEIHLRATIEDGWHVYAQVQPENAVSKPTSIKFKTGDDFTTVGKVKELGKMVKWEDPTSGLGANEYSGMVDFVQVVKVSNPALAAITGVITFQTCTDHMCLSPEDVNFSVPLK